MTARLPFREPPRTAVLTVAIVAICIALYVMAAALSAIIETGGFEGFGRYLGEPDGNVQYDLGTGGLISFLQGDLWSLLASCYLHIDLSHLVGNMLTLAIIFPLVAGALGPMRGFVLYTLAGFGGSLAAIIAREHFSMGASGGICGLFGALIIIGLREGGVAGWRKVIVGGILAGSSFTVSTGSYEISYAAHAGGLTTGLIAAWLLPPPGQFGLTRYLYQVSVAMTVLSLAFGAGNSLWWTWEARVDPPAYAAHLAKRNAVDTNRVLASEPRTANDYLQRSGAYMQQNNIEAALADISRAIELDPSPRNYLARANFYLRQNCPADALADYQAAIEQGTTDDIHRNRGLAYLALKDYDKAIADFTVALKFAPDDASILNNRAWALYLAGRAAEGLPDIEKSLEISPGIVASLDTRAHIFEAMGDREKAIADYRAALAIEPDLKESRDGLLRLGIEP